jgi:hypothetical protein
LTVGELALARAQIALQAPIRQRVEPRHDSNLSAV